jgi:hypothetical protein
MTVLFPQDVPWEGRQIGCASDVLPRVKGAGASGAPRKRGITELSFSHWERSGLRLGRRPVCSDGPPAGGLE